MCVKERTRGHIAFKDHSLRLASPEGDLQALITTQIHSVSETVRSDSILYIFTTQHGLKCHDFFKWYINKIKIYSMFIPWASMGGVQL